MPEVRFSPQSLNTFKELLEDSKKGFVDEVCVEIIADVSEIGREQASQEVGYEDTEKQPIKITGHGAKGGIILTREGIKFKEFGTGIIVEMREHPYARTNGWVYNQGTKIDDNGMWVYKDRHTGKFITTSGQKASATFFHASQTMRGNLISVSKRVLGGK
jgi:hypothetical protein